MAFNRQRHFLSWTTHDGKDLASRYPSFLNMLRRPAHLIVTTTFVPLSSLISHSFCNCVQTLVVILPDKQCATLVLSVIPVVSFTYKLKSTAQKKDTQIYNGLFHLVGVFSFIWRPLD